MPKPVYDSIMKYFNRLLEMYTGNPDYSVLINYVNYVVKLPWNKSTKETLDLVKAKHVDIYLILQLFSWFNYFIFIGIAIKSLWYG